MTGKLYCPFCHRALARHGVQCKEYGVCRDENCPSERNFLPIEIWQALIDGKKAQDALKGIKIRVAAIRGCVQDGYTQLGERNRNIFIALELFKDLIKEITSITKQDG